MGRTSRDLLAYGFVKNGERLSVLEDVYVDVAG